MSVLRVVNDTGQGRDTRVYIDGEELTTNFTEARIAISAAARGDVEITLNPLVFEVDTGTFEVTGNTKLVFFEQTRDLLVKHGWTPPETVTAPVPERADHQ
jgi:hypothetical protein